jgi:hypothetical protein
MKTTDQLKPNFGPVYAAAMYPGLAAIFHRHGYALACHGSLSRDFDLIAVPWAESVSDAATVLQDVTTEYALKLIGEPERKNHNRTAYTLSCGFGDCAIDLSFLPTSRARSLNSFDNSPGPS